MAEHSLPEQNAAARLRPVGAQLSISGKRERNEDRSVLLFPQAGQQQRRAVAAVADGVSGAQHGQEAAQAAVDAVEQAAVAFLAGPERADRAVSNAFEKAQRAVRAIVERTGSSASTTLTVVAIDGETLHYGHVGDSRLYLFREGQTEKLTRDEVTADGRLDQAIGYATPLEVANGSQDLLPQDRLLLCTDGLAPDGSMDDEQLGLRLAAGGSMDERLESLVAQAQKRGSQDNITAVLVEFEPGDTRQLATDEASPATQDARAGLRLRGIWPAAALLIALMVGLLLGWILRPHLSGSSASAPTPSGPLGSPELVATLAEDSRLIGAAAGGGVVVAAPGGPVLTLDQRSPVPLPQLLGRVTLSNGPTGYLVYWADATHSVVRRTEAGVEKATVPEEQTPDSIVVDDKHNIWVIFTGKLYVVRPAIRRHELEGANTHEHEAR